MPEFVPVATTEELKPGDRIVVEVDDHYIAVFNVGGGIVFDSTAEAEYEECLLKARFAVGDQWISR